MSTYCYALVEFERWDRDLRARLARSGITPWRAEDAVAYSRFPTSMTVRVAGADEREAMGRLLGVLPPGAHVISSMTSMPAEPGEDALVRELVADARHAA